MRKFEPKEIANKNMSYVAAMTFPEKLLKNRNVIAKNGKIVPIHIQINPTNKCNLHCSICSCENRQKNLEIDFDKLKKIIADASMLGCMAATITGGGEPLLYPYINELIELLSDYGINIGIATNGTMFNKLNAESYNKIMWCRISCMDERNFDNAKAGVEHAVANESSIDWAFSYVIQRISNIKNLIKVIQFANANNFTHVRLVTDIFDLDGASEMKLISKTLKHFEIDDSKVIYQNRKLYTKGRKECLISLLKPVIDADGNLYPCCSAQCAQYPAPKSYAEIMRMGNASDLIQIHESQKYFDGSICERCYYDEYNRLLKRMTNIKNIGHLNFV